MHALKERFTPKGPSQSILSVDCLSSKEPGTLKRVWQQEGAQMNEGHLYLCYYQSSKLHRCERSVTLRMCAETCSIYDGFPVCKPNTRDAFISDGTPLKECFTPEIKHVITAYSSETDRLQESTLIHSRKHFIFWDALWCSETAGWDAMQQFRLERYFKVELILSCHSMMGETGKHEIIII